MKKQEIKTGASIAAMVRREVKNPADYSGAESAELLYRFCLQKAERMSELQEPDRTRKINGKEFKIWDSITVEIASGYKTWSGRVCFADVRYYEHMDEESGSFQNFIRY